MLTVRLTATAKRDIARVLRRTKDDFGEHQARRYAQLIREGIEDTDAGRTVDAKTALAELRSRL